METHKKKKESKKNLYVRAARNKAISRDERWSSEVFLYSYVGLIDFALVAGTFGPPQFVYLFINLSVPTSPVLCLHA